MSLRFADIHGSTTNHHRSRTCDGSYDITSELIQRSAGWGEKQSPQDTFKTSCVLHAEVPQGRQGGTHFPTKLENTCDLGL